MKLSKYQRAKQRGFSLISGFILVIILFGALAFFLAGRGINAGYAANYAMSSKVSGFLAQIGYVATGFDAVLLNGTAPSLVTFDTTATTGVFNPTTGGATPQALDQSLFISPLVGTAQGYLVYKGAGITLNSVGTAAADYTLAVSGLTLTACRQINNTLHGTALTAVVPPLALFAEADVILPATTAASPTSLLAADLSPTGVARRMNGCYVTTDTAYVYIHTLLAQ